ncbi:hypothetical protein LX36DRAFT_681008 [Colletotrichum falcatum]|nr:hypothetical protein LX36DRAFT_681008 [Colletotrichum falcatum]
MHKTPAFGRAALKTVGRMPVISEDGSATAIANPSPAALAPPPPPCRGTTPRSYGRSPMARPVYPHPSYPPPAYSRNPARDSIRSFLDAGSNLGTRSTHSARSIRSINSNVSLSSSVISTPASSYKESYKENARLLPSTTPGARDTAEKKGRGSSWVPHRGAWYRLFILAVVAAGFVAGLSVGLTAWNRQSQPAVSADASNETNSLPSGSFAFNTALLQANTACTSDSSTWRCFPDRTYSQSPNASAATFFWTIYRRDSSTYQISSSSSSSSSSLSPISPKFSDEVMTLLERGSPDERLVFNFTLPKTTAPSDAAAQDGRAATCTFADTAFSATLWTRRNATAAADGADGNVGRRVWPGQVEIVQASRGGPECKDAAGNAVSVAAGDGQCKCMYANFDFVVQEKRRRRRR